MDRRRALMMAGSGAAPRLPSAYQEVEWIGYNTSKQYLYTSILAGDVVKVVADIAKTSVPTNGSVFPKASGSTNWGTIENISGSKWTCSPSFSKETLFDRTTLTSIKGSVPDSSEVAIGYSTATFCPSLHYYTLKLLGENDVILFDGVPCYRKSDDAIGMYDIITSAFIQTEGDKWKKGPDVT